MKKFAKGQIKRNQDFLLFHSLHLLVRLSNSEILSWPNSPLLVMLEFIDPNELLIGDLLFTPLQDLAGLADSRDYSTHETQLILAKQLIEHGANVNDVSPEGKTPLHNACYAGNVTNLDFVELLLEAGADPKLSCCWKQVPIQIHRIILVGLCSPPFHEESRVKESSSEVKSFLYNV
jgi:ankyrin repeat protein